MKYRITHTTKYAYSQAVPICHNLVRLAPRSLEHQICSQFRLVVHPEPIDVVHRQDYFGNHVSYFSIDQAHHGLSVTSSSQVEVSQLPASDAEGTPAWDNIADLIKKDRSPEILAAYQFTTPSSRIPPFAALGDYARMSFRVGRPILAALLELTSRIHEEFTYDPRATTIQTPLEEVSAKRHGVCQDFAHLQIGCLRSLGLAARYVSGYMRTEPPPGKPRLVGADASHAWLSVYCGDAGWVDVDPTNDALASHDYITVAWGRDYNDICPIQGVFVGGGEHRMEVSVDVAPHGV